MNRKLIIISLSMFFGFFSVGMAQPKKSMELDTIYNHSICIDNFCLCSTTLTDLKKIANDISLVEVEEMDLPKNCYGHDVRYINGQGYYSKNFPGIIFQKESGDNDFISKIRLTKNFRGNLPNNQYINLSDLKLRDVFLIFPKFKDKWGSRDCSNYWNFSNDTISFYVKIDTTIKPRYPIKEEYYLDKQVEAIDLILSCQPPVMFRMSSINAKEPLYILDGIPVNSGVIKLFDPNEIAVIQVLKDSSATMLFGSEGKNGVILITTKESAQKAYWNYFKLKSSEYGKAISSIKDEVNVVYILNNQVLGDDYISKLFFINDSNFIDLKVIDKKQLKNHFNIENKKWGVVIRITEDNKN